MEELINQMKALGVIRFITMYFIIALEFILNLPYTIIRAIYLIINSMCNKANKMFKRERIILLLKVGFIRKFLYKCREDYKNYIKESKK